MLSPTSSTARDLLSAGNPLPNSLVEQPSKNYSLKQNDSDPDQLKESFQDFVGQTFFSQMIKSLRSTEKPSAYMHGGRAEEVFQGQLDQILSEELSQSSADKLAEPMYELFMLKRS